MNRDRKRRRPRWKRSAGNGIHDRIAFNPRDTVL